MIYVKRYTEGEPVYVQIPEPVYVMLQRNGIAIRTEKAHKALGLLDPKGQELWQLSGREALPEAVETVELVSREEYEQWSYLQDLPPEPDPEDTEPVVPEGVEEETILTRAELTERVRILEEELAKAMALLYPEGEEGEDEP